MPQSTQSYLTSLTGKIMETYTVLMLSMDHITEDDNNALHAIAHRHPHSLDHPFAQMIKESDCGYFIKLFDQADYNDLATHPTPLPEDLRFSPSLAKIISYAHAEGHRMIEFDYDGPTYPNLFTIHDWGW